MVNVSGDVNFEESAWTYPLVIGLADAKPIDVCFAVILLLLNLCSWATSFEVEKRLPGNYETFTSSWHTHPQSAKFKKRPGPACPACPLACPEPAQLAGMQLIFSGIILGPDFLGEEFDTKKDVAQRWRTSFAHDYKCLRWQTHGFLDVGCSVWQSNLATEYTV